MGLELMPDSTTTQPDKPKTPKAEPKKTRFKQGNGRFGQSTNGMAGKSDEQNIKQTETK